jgi:hypothetical protein
MDLEYVLGELRRELDGIEAAILSLERLRRPGNPRLDHRLDLSMRSGSNRANGFLRNSAPEESS